MGRRFIHTKRRVKEWETQPGRSLREDGEESKDEQKYSHMKDCPLIADYRAVTHG